MVKAQAWVKRNLQGDPYIWAIAILLSLIGILVVYSAVSVPAFKFQDGDTEHYLFRHVFMIGLSLVAMWVTHKINYTYYSRISRVLLFIAVPLLLYTFLNGQTINGASRWITIPVINMSFQTSDLAKLALISNIASMLAKRQNHIKDFQKSIFPVMVWTGVICGLIALSDFSTAFMLFATSMLLMFIGRVPGKYIFGLVGIGVLFITIALLIGDRGATFSSRIADFFNIVSGNADINETPYQVQRSYMAIAKGGFMGSGLGESQQRYFLPEAFSDYIFAILIEEHGLKIAFVVILLYLAFLWRGMVTVAKSDRAFGGLLSAGLSFSLVIQAFINIAVVVGLGPVTGLPLPFISMGGTSLLFSGMAVGIILSVSRASQGEEVLDAPANENVESTSTQNEAIA